MNVLISKVELWGFTLSDERLLLFKVLDEVITHDTMLVQQVRNVTDSVGVIKEANMWRIDFRHAKIRPFESSSKSLILVRSASLNISADFSINYNFQIDVSPSDFEYLVFSTGFTAGSTIAGANQTWGAYLGAGLILVFEYHSFLVTINYGETNIQGTYRFDINEKVTRTERSPGYLKAEAHIYGNSDSKMLITLGSYRFFSKSGWGNKETFWGFKLGIGLKFF
ncbi:MAG: hypothetical protein HY960_15215 [Ignavibacteriae bacterium]|nr:hypothetical protein [Ignavibacteriota bacterium]